MMKLHVDSHLDHGFTPAQVSYICTRFAARDGFFIETFEMPEELGSVPCGLYGPSVGDDPVHKQATEFARRGDRAYLSRVLISGRTRPTQTVTVIAGPHSEPCICKGVSPGCTYCNGTGTATFSCILYTAFGGPAAPREPDDPTLPPEQRAQSVAFWKDHALAPESNSK